MALYILYYCNIHRILVKVFYINNYKRYLAIMHKVVHLIFFKWFKSDWAVFQPKANSSTSIKLHPVSNIVYSFLAMYLHQSSSVDLALPSAAVETTKSKTDIVITGRQNVVYMSCVYLFAKHVFVCY